MKVDLPSLNVACAVSSRSTSGGGLPLLSGVLLNDGFPPWNVAGAGSIMSISGGLQLLSGFFLNDDCPSLNVACVGSVRTTTWGGLAAVVRCCLESRSSIIECCWCWK